MSGIRRQAPVPRTGDETEANETRAIRESGGTALRSVAETVDTPVEPVSALEAQGDIPGLDDNSRLGNAPDRDRAASIAGQMPVGAGPGKTEKTPSHPAHPQAAAFRNGEPAGPKDADVQVRPAGPNAMRSRLETWDEVDEAADESFPASDPPARY